MRVNDKEECKGRELGNEGIDDLCVFYIILIKFTRVMLVEDSKKKNIPWVEKYRPSSLEDVIAHEDIVSTSKLNTYG